MGGKQGRKLLADPVSSNTLPSGILTSQPLKSVWGIKLKVTCLWPAFSRGICIDKKFRRNGIFFCYFQRKGGRRGNISAWQIKLIKNSRSNLLFFSQDSWRKGQQQRELPSLSGWCSSSPRDESAVSLWWSLVLTLWLSWACQHVWQSIGLAMLIFVWKTTRMSDGNNAQ